jgi:hypothetical protein
MPEIGKGRITPGTGSVNYGPPLNSPNAPNAAVPASVDGEGGRDLLLNLRARVVSAEDKLVHLTQDIQNFSGALNSFETLITNEEGGNTSVADVLSTYHGLTDQVSSLNTTLSLVSTRVGTLEDAANNPDDPLDLTAIEAALTTIDGRLDALDDLVADAGDQITTLVAGLANAVTSLATKAEQAGVDAIAASVLTKANKSTKVNTGGLISGAGDLTSDINLVVPKATAAEVDAGIVDHKAVTPASLLNVLASIRNIEQPIGIGTTNLINTRLWLPGTTGSQGTFTELVTFASAKNAVALAGGPLGTIEPVWTATTLPAAVSAVNDVNGGFEYTVTSHADDFDPKHSFRFSAFVKTDSTSGTLNFRCFDTVVGLNGQPVSTPAFLSDFVLPQQNKWYLLIGVVHGSTFTGDDATSGIYDPATGLKVVDGLTYKSKAGVETQKLRIYRQNASVNGSKFEIARPRIDIITGEEPSIRALFGTANDLDKVNKTTTVTGGGLVTGGGDLTQNRTLTVAKATDAAIQLGVDDTTVITPKGLKNNLTFVLPKATDIDMAALTNETAVVTPKALRALPKATPADVTAKTSNDVFLTPASLVGVDLGTGGGGGTANVDIATSADVTAGVNNTKMVTPLSLTGLKKATPSDVAAKTSTSLIVTPASLAGLILPTQNFATTADVANATSNSLIVTPLSIASVPKSLATLQQVQQGVSASTAISPQTFRAMAATAGDVNTGTNNSAYVTPAALAASDIGTAVTNFTASNDLNGDPIVAPVVHTDGTAVDHVLNTDGSADISFEWTWAGTNSDIDGFVVVFHVSTSSTPYPFDGSGEEFSVVVPADKRALLHPGVAADKYYSYAVKAFRIVQSSVNATGFIYSTLSPASTASSSITASAPTDATEYLFTDPSQEFTLYVSLRQARHHSPGVAGNKYYSFGVRAYRIVDQDIDPTGFIKTASSRRRVLVSIPTSPARALLSTAIFRARQQRVGADRH